MESPAHEACGTLVETVLVRADICQAAITTLCYLGLYNAYFVIILTSCALGLSDGEAMLDSSGAHMYVGGRSRPKYGSDLRAD